jgi:predicted nucleic acid-binding protein
VRRYLVDSNILIYYLGGQDEAVSFIQSQIDRCAVSIVSYYEVLNYPFENEEAEQEVRAFLSLFPVIPVDREIAERALENRRKRRIKMADNFIAATAQLHGWSVVTRNGEDFREIVEVIDPFAERGV